MTHDIAKIDNYSVYRRLGNKKNCTTTVHERLNLDKYFLAYTLFSAILLLMKRSVVHLI